MAITFNAAGTAATATSGNITPTLPAGFLADDIHCLVVHSFDNVAITLPAGWTITLALNNGVSQRVSFAWRRAVGGDTNPLVTHAAGGSIIGRIAGFRGAITSGDPFEASSSKANASSATVTATGITTLTADDMIVFAGGSTFVGTFSTYSGANPTFSEAMDSNFAGEDDAIFLAYGTKNDVSATGDRTAVCTGAGVNVGMLLAMKPPAGASAGNLAWIVA